MKKFSQKKSSKLTSSIKTKTNLALSAVLIIVFTGLTMLVYNFVHKRIEKDSNENMVSHLKDLNTILANHVKTRQENVNMALNLADNMFKQCGNISEANSMLTINATNQITNETRQVQVPKWHLNGALLQNNTELVDNIKANSVETATIFQKIDKGYLRISTNVLNQNGERAINTYIPNSSEVIKTIEQGKTYKGRAFVVDQWYLTAYKPLYIGKEIKGILYVGVPEMDSETIKKVFDEKKYFEHGYPFLIDDKGNLVVHPTMEGKNLAQTSFFNQLHHESDEVHKSEYRWPETADGKEKIQFFTYFEPYKSYISTSIYKEDMYGSLNRLVRIVSLIIMICGAVIFLTLNRFLTPIINQMKLMAEKAEEIASGNLTTNVHTTRKDELGQLANALNKMIDKLRNVVNEIVSGAHQINSSGIQFDSTSQDISQGASEQASSVEEVSSTMEEFVANIEANTANSTATEKISKQVVLDIQQVNEKAQKAQEFNKLIEQKIGAISDIAFQTNILALNAAIEASKAGEQGRGFSVVADQVRKLAESSKGLAEEIVVLVRDSVEMTESAGNDIRDIIPSIEKTSQLVQNITAAGEELSSGVQQINSALQQINASTTENAAGSEELAAGAKELSSQSTYLMNLVSYFKIDEKAKKLRKEVSASDLLTLKKDTESRKQTVASVNQPVINLDENQLDEYEKF